MSVLERIERPSYTHALKHNTNYGAYEISIYIPQQSSACKPGQWFCWASVLPVERSWVRTASCLTKSVAMTTTTTAAAAT